MARYKDYDYTQGKFIPVHFNKQILPGTFEHTLHYLISNELDISIFDLRYKNDETGAPAYDPAILLKIILYAYSKGITSSRQIAQCCRENVVFMALSADTRPHFTTIADIHAGQNIKYLSTQLGHSSIKITLDIYGHLFNDDDFNRKQADLLETSFNSVRKPLEKPAIMTKKDSELNPKSLICNSINEIADGGHPFKGLLSSPKAPLYVKRNFSRFF